MNEEQLSQMIEAILFVADESVSVQDLAVLLEVPSATIESVLDAMRLGFEAQGRGVVLRQVGGGWRMSTHPDAKPFLEKFISESRAAKMSQAALETLAIIAYRQPISRGQIAEIRGVSSEGVLRTLILRGVVEETGRDAGPGQAIFYGTTPEFLERVGLNSLDDLPALPEFMPDPSALERMEAGLGPGV